MQFKLEQVALACIALVAIVVGGYWQGTMSERWGSFPQIGEFAERMAKVPMDVGNWKGKVSPDADARTREVAGIRASVSRSYTNPKGETVVVNLVCGKVNDMFYHTPDRCYPAAGFEASSDIKQIEVDAGATKAEFRHTSFKKQSDNGVVAHQVYWSFSDGDQWRTPVNYKWEMQGQRALYKLYVLSPPENDRQTQERTVTVEFLKDFLPVLDEVLAPKPKAEAKSTAGASKA